jgi:hypothetical protein
VRGKPLWKWIARIAALCKKVIDWKSLDSDDAILAFSANGVDFKTWEKQHPDFNIDIKFCSHKFKSCAAKYIIVLSVYHSKCLFIEGPFRGGMHDLDMFRTSGLMKKLKESGKICITDRGFRSRYGHESKHFSYPDFMDSKELYNFKSRARQRQETFNRRLKHFEALSSTFKNGFVKHGIALRAVAVIVQYQMDNGSPLFSV